jgi:hypothetical protein
MLGLACNVLPSGKGCPMLSRLSVAGGTAKTLAAAIIVPSVPPVSPHNYMWEEKIYEGYAQRVLVASPAANMRQVRHRSILQAFAVQGGRDRSGTAGPVGLRWYTITSPGGEIPATSLSRPGKLVMVKPIGAPAALIIGRRGSYTAATRPAGLTFLKSACQIRRTAPGDKSRTTRERRSVQSCRGPPRRQG